MCFLSMGISNSAYNNIVRIYTGNIISPFLDYLDNYCLTIFLNQFI